MALLASSPSPGADRGGAPIVLLDYVDGGEHRVRFFLNPRDLSAAALERIERDSNVWLWTEGGPTQGVIDSVERNDEWKTYRGGLVLHLGIPRQVKPGWAVLAFQPFPAQGWTAVDVAAGEKSGIARRLGYAPDRLTLGRFQAGGRQYLVVDYWLPCPDGSEECGDYNEVETTVYQGTGNTDWTKVVSFVDGGCKPLVDIDGDGAPECVGSTGYQGYVLRSIIPKNQIIFISHSGV